MSTWFVAILLAACCVLSTHGKASKRYEPHFSAGVQLATVTTSDVREASGLCASRLHPHVLYTHNDSGDHTHSIYAISTKDGSEVSRITITGATNRDWEDIACGPCAGSTGEYCIYIADTGGNVHASVNTIYRIKEPTTLKSHITVDLDSTMLFSWDEHNCETVMVDPNGELYVVSKVDGGDGRMVHLPASAWGSHHRAATHHGIHLHLNSTRNDPVGGDISPTGYEVLIKTITKVNYYYVPDRDYLKHMTSSPSSLPYERERQGEAIAWHPNVRGYYTLGEGTHQPLWFYERIHSIPVVG